MIVQVVLKAMKTKLLRTKSIDKRDEYDIMNNNNKNNNNMMNESDVQDEIAEYDEDSTVEENEDDDEDINDAVVEEQKDLDAIRCGKIDAITPQCQKFLDQRNALDVEIKELYKHHQNNQQDENCRHRILVYLEQHDQLTNILEEQDKQMIILQYGKTYVDEPTVGFYCKHEHEHLEKILVQLQQQQVREEETKGEKQKVKFEDTNGFKLVGVQGTTEIYTFLHP